MKSDKNTTIINTFLLILFLVILAIIIYLIYTNFYSDWLAKNQQKPTLITTTTDTNPENNVTSNTTTTDSSLATFSYSYPSTWTVEENVDADFTTIRDTKGDNAITIRVAKKPESIKNLTLEEYSRVAAINEIQGFKELISITPITTDYDDKGYETVWKISFLGSEDYSSNPITYFAHPFDPTKSIQVNLENANYLNEYNFIIKSFAIK